jgi:site-specific DNA-methyltransferase (adenine-specific)
VIETNKIHLGDCLDLLPSVPDKSIDLILTDLPFGTTSAKGDTMIPLEPLWKEYNRIIKSPGAIVLFAVQPFSSLLVCANIKNYAHQWIWEKDKGANFCQVKYAPFKEHEEVLVFKPPGGKNKYFPIMERRRGNGLNNIGNTYIPNFEPNPDGVVGPRLKQGKETVVKELRYPRSIQHFNRECGLSTTQKPLALCEYLVKTYSEENDLVLDNTCGSGTSCLAAAKLKRNWIGIENDPDMFLTATKRLEAYDGIHQTIN